MATTYFPFDAGAGANITEDQWRKMARFWRDTGVLYGEGGEFEVTAQGPAAMAVDVATGTAWIRGHYFDSDATTQVSIAAADPSDDRIDRIVIRVDFGANTIAIDVLEGTPAASPTAPALTQSTSTWEISLAQVAVASGAGTIIAANITDERTISYGGIVPVVTALPSNPTDGMEVDYVAAGTITTPTVVWRLRYVDSISDAYKWVFVGGRELQATVAASESQASLTSVTSSWGNMATVGPDIVVPLDGIYDLTGRAKGNSSYLDGAQAYYGIAVGNDVPFVSVLVGVSAGGTSAVQNVTLPLEYRGALTGGATLRGRYLYGGPFNISERWVGLTPVRVG